MRSTALEVRDSATHVGVDVYLVMAGTCLLRPALAGDGAD